MATPSRSAQRDAIRRVQRALGRETHILAESPGDLWQQLYNRLQWQARPGSALAARLVGQFEPRTATPTRPWLHNRTPQSESEALVATLPNDERTPDVCAFSPDGRLALGAGDYVLTVHDLESGAQISLRTGQSVAKALIFSPSGQTAALVTAGALLLYDAPSNTISTALSYSYDEHVSLHAAVFVGDRLLVASEWDTTATILDGHTGATVGKLEGGLFRPCIFSHSGDLLLTMTTLNLWDVRHGSHLAKYTGAETRGVRCAFSPDDSRFASGDGTGLVTVRSVPDGEVVATWRGHADGVEACAFTPDGRLLVTASRDQTLGVWDATSGEQVASLTGHAGPVVACAVSHDGRRVLSGSWDKTLKVWDISEAGSATDGASHRGRVTACRVTADGALAVSSSDDHEVRTWDIASGRCRTALEGHTGAVTSCAVSRDGRSALSSSDDKTLRLWDIEGQTCTAVFEGHEGAVTSCALSPVGNIAASCSRDGTVRLWDARSGTCLEVLQGHQYAVNACDFSPDGRWVVSAGDDETVRLWHAAAGVCRFTLRGNSRPVQCCTFSPDGRYIAAAGWDNRVRLWEAASGRPYAILDGHTWANDRDGIRYCHFSPNGRLLVSGAFDGTLRLWDVARAMQAHVFEEPGRARRYPTCAAFSRDNRRVAAGFEGSLHVLDAGSGESLLTFRCPSAVTAVAFSPTGDAIVAGHSGGVVAILEPYGLDSVGGAS